MNSGKLIRRFCAAITLLMCTVGAASTPFTLDGFLADMAGVSATDGRFTETLTLDILESPLISHGTLSYRRPDYLMKKIELPEHMMFEAAGDRMVIETEQERRTLSLDTRPGIRAFVESYRATLSGDRTVLEKYYEVTLSGDHEHWTLRLQPKTTEMKSLVRHIELNGSGTRIERIMTLESTGGLSLMSITPNVD